ncbi:hypothetical protein [Ruegeria arenilitoris]|uniref:hypothetical protein n=1 Tax=Ruegeria arenilitoris TaxID=1173585 RepID=UPI00147C30EB|nr:hypothetical protein [Ruegeria arenilitoris]
MEIEATGSAIIRHAGTGEDYEIGADELEWELVSSQERGMGTETLYGATIYHPELGLLQWSISEYPPGAENYTMSDFGDHETLTNFSIELVHEPEDQDKFESAISEVKEWFRSQYDDPANWLPYESASDGYQWLHGGPYSASEALEQGFSGAYPEWLLQRAAREIENEAGGILEWTPIPEEEIAASDSSSSDFNSSDFFTDKSVQSPNQPEILSVNLNDRRNVAGKLEADVAKVLDLLKPFVDLENDRPSQNNSNDTAGIGHNRPPSPLEDLGLPPDFFSTLENTARQLGDNTKALEKIQASIEERRQSEKASVDALEQHKRAVEDNTKAITERTEQLQSLKKTGLWAGGIWVGDKIVGNAIGTMGSKLGEIAITVISEPRLVLDPLLAALAELIATATKYIGAIPTLF